MQSSGFILGGEKPLSYSMCRALVKKSLAAVDAAGYTSHDFRDTCATEWMEAGVNMKVISQKHYTGKKLTYRTNLHPLAGPYWFQRMKDGGGRDTILL